MIVATTRRLVLREAVPGDAAFVLRLTNEPSWRTFIARHSITTVSRAAPCSREEFRRCAGCTGRCCPCHRCRNEFRPTGKWGVPEPVGNESRSTHFGSGECRSPSGTRAVDVMFSDALNRSPRPMWVGIHSDSIRDCRNEFRPTGEVLSGHILVHPLRAKVPAMRGSLCVGRPDKCRRTAVSCRRRGW